MLKSDYYTICLFLCGNVMQNKYFLIFIMFLSLSKVFIAIAQDPLVRQRLPLYLVTDNLYCRMVQRSGTQCHVILETKHLSMFLNRISTTTCLLSSHIIYWCVVFLSHVLHVYTSFQIFIHVFTILLFIFYLVTLLLYGSMKNSFCWWISK